MGVTKSQLYSPDHNRMADMAKVLGHPARIAILEHLIKQDACICVDLSAKIGLAQATISQHLRELRRVGIIKGSITKNARCYCIDVNAWTEMAGLFARLFAKDPTENCC